MRIPYIRACQIRNDECVCSEEQKKLCSNFQLVPDTKTIREDFLRRRKEHETNHKMQDVIDKFIKEKKLKPGAPATAYNEKGKKVYYKSIEDFLEQVYLHLRKNSFIKF